MLQYSSTSTVRAAPELYRFFFSLRRQLYENLVNDEVMWPLCELSSSPLIRLEINNACAALALFFFFFGGQTSPLLHFLLSWKQQQLADCPSAPEMIKTAPLGGTGPPPCCTKTILLAACHTVHLLRGLTTRLLGKGMELLC